MFLIALLGCKQK